MNITPVVKQLLIINIIFFFGTEYIGNYAYELFSLYYPEFHMFRFWQPLTHMFMHGGLMHIAFNMFALYMFGSTLEHFWGGKKFLFFYISCGLGAAMLHVIANYVSLQYVMNNLSSLHLSKADYSVILNTDYKTVFDSNNQMIEGNYKAILDKVHCTQEQYNTLTTAINNFQTPAVGASGAIYGLLIAFAFMFPNAELMLMFIPFPIKAKYFVPGLVAMDLFSGFTGYSIMGGGIAHFAHIGGAITGFIMMWIWKKNQFNDKRWN